MSKSKARNIFTFCTLLLFLLLLPVIGCNKSLRATKEHPRNVSVLIDELVPEAIHIIEEGLADEDPRVRMKAIEVVAATKQIRLMPKVQRLLRDDFVPVRFASALAVGDMEYNLAESSTRQLLEDENQNVKIAAVYALTRLGTSQDLDVICQAITSSDQNVRANAALLLGKSGDSSVLKFLYWAIQDDASDDKVRFQAAEAVAMLGDERIYPKLWSMLISAYTDDRVVGVRAMGALGTAEAKNALTTMLGDDMLEVRLAAAEKLGKLGDTTGEAKVLDVFTKNLTAKMDKGEQEQINARAALAIGEIGTAGVMKYLPQLLEDESKLVRIAAAKAVFQCAMKN